MRVGLRAAQAIPYGKGTMTKSAIRSLFTVFAGALVGSLVAQQAVAQTQFTTGAIEVRQFLPRSATDVYAAGHGAGLHRSTDGGATWSRIALPGNVRYLTSIAGNTTGYFLVGAMEGLLRTTDGTTFTQVIFEPVAAVAVAPSPSGFALAAVKGLGIVRSTDSGASWGVANNTGFDSLDITSVAFDPNNPNIAYAGAKPSNSGVGGGVFRSTDGGQTWVAQNAGLAASDKQVTSVVVDGSGNAYAGVLRACDPVYAVGFTCDGAGDVWRSAGGTGTWTASGDLFGTVSLHRDTNSPATIWVGSRGLGLLSGSGSNFTYAFNNQAGPGLLNTGVNAVAALPGSQTVLKALKGAGVWQSTANASPRSWVRVSFPGADRVLSAANVGANPVPTSMLAGLHAGGVWRTTNGGASWTPPTENPGVQNDFSFFPGFEIHFLSIWELASSATNANLTYAAAGGVGMFYMNDSTGLFRWNGSAWQGVGSNNNINGDRTVAPWNGAIEAGTLQIPSEPIYGVSLNRANDNLAYASFLNFSPGVRYRNNSGVWANSTLSGVITPQTRTIAHSSNAARMLALVFDDKPALSTDSGVSFNRVTVSQFGFERLRFFAASENPANGSFWAAATNKGIFRSADQGATWTRANTAGVFVRQAVSAIGYRADGKLFAADFEGNRYCSADTGVTWVALGQLRAGVNAIRTIGATGNNLYYLTDGAGFFREDGTC